MTGLAPNRTSNLADVIERILDKGLVINADIAVSIAGTELLGIKIRATLASFETAAKYGLELPSGTNFNAPGWKEASMTKAACPECGHRREEKLLIREGCPLCGWYSPMQNLHLISPPSDSYD
jgi:gas vesicle structural protein